MRASQSLLVPVLLATAVAVPAFAQQGAQSLTNYPACTSTPTKQDSDQAHSAFLLGKRFFDEADYGSAIHNFADAYKLDCTKTELLTIVARAYELNGNRPEAVHALETYLQRAQNISADDKAQIQKRIDNLKAQIAAQAPTVTAPPPPTAPAAAPTRTAPPPLPPPPPPAEVRGHTALPWVVAGVGVAAAAVGGVLFLVESNAKSSALDKCVGDSLPCTPNSGQQLSTIQSNYNSANGLIPVGSILFYSGLGVAAGGLLWHFLEPTGPVKDSKASLTPAVGPGFAGAAIGGSF